MILKFFTIIFKKITHKLKIKPYDPLPYLKNPYLLTYTEFLFYKSLSSNINNNIHICPKVGIKEFIYISKSLNFSDHQRHFNRISKKHVDFLLCDKYSMKPLCGIELDDYTHKRKKTIERDLLIENIYKSANFPLVRIKVSNHYPKHTFDCLSPFIKMTTDVIPSVAYKEGL